MKLCNFLGTGVFSALCLALTVPVAHAGQVQITIEGSTNALCCGTVIHDSFLERSYKNEFVLPGALNSAYEGASVDADLATGTVRGLSYVTNTGNHWLAMASDSIRIDRLTPGAGSDITVPIIMRIVVSASSTLNDVGDVFSSADSAARLDLGRQTGFGLSDVDFAEFRWQHVIDKAGPGGSDTFNEQRFGNVAGDPASKAGFSITLVASRDAFISAGAMQSSEFGFSFSHSATLFGMLGGGGSFDSTHTAQIYLELPEGFGFTSASGLLLSQPPIAAVPEPQAAILMLAGMGLLWGRVRNGRRRGT